MCSTALIFSNKNHDLQKQHLIEKNTKKLLSYMLYTHDVTSKRVDEITGVMVSIKRSIKTKTIWKNCFFNKCYIISRLPVTMCIYINTDNWPEHYFKQHQCPTRTFWGGKMIFLSNSFTLLSMKHSYSLQFELLIVAICWHLFLKCGRDCYRTCKRVKMH